jgi:3-phenylpropionate/trans-cinnamate dioxygenase ferredoxin subunit
VDEYIRVDRVGEIPDGEGRVFEIAGREVAVFNCRGTYFAVSALCSHADAYLNEGSLDRIRCTVECPLHGAEFDLRSGRVLTPPAEEPLDVFAVRVEAGAIEVAKLPRR